MMIKNAFTEIFENYEFFGWIFKEKFIIFLVEFEWKMCSFSPAPNMDGLHSCTPSRGTPNRDLKQFNPRSYKIKISFKGTVSVGFSVSPCEDNARYTMV